MTPFDFIDYYGNSSPNDPILDINQAMHKPLVISSANSEWEVLSYYYDRTTKEMVIDIKKKKISK